MTCTHHIKAFALAAALLLGSAITGQARTITWGSSVGDALLDGNGQALGNDVTFELGSFGSFVPTAANVSQWAANWKTFDTANVGNGGWSPVDSFVNSSATLNADGTSTGQPSTLPFTFAQGEQAYIWVYRPDQLATTTSEWALVTNDSTDSNSLDDWTFPAHSDQTILPLDWRFSNASDVIFGGLNSVQGPGTHNDNPTTFDLQLHTVVPEPSSALLAASALVSLGLRRRRTAQV